MNLDKNTILTITFTLVDEIMKEPHIAKRLIRPGVKPKLTDSEIITISMYQELIGENREDHFFRLHGEELKSYFPHINERSRYNRRKRDLGQVFTLIKKSLGVILGLYQVKTVAIDSAPVPVVGYKRDKKHTDFTDAEYGYCSSKALKYFGFKLHSLVSMCGSIIDYCLTHAASYDDQVVEEFLEKNKQTIDEVFGDKAYVSQELKKLLREYMGVWLYTPKKKNAKNTTQHLNRQQSKLRLMVETVNAQLQEQFKLSKHYAKSKWGLLTRISAKITAHTMGQVINLMLGRPRLALAELAV